MRAVATTALMAALLLGCEEAAPGRDTSARLICQKFIASRLRDPGSVQWEDDHKWPAQLEPNSDWIIVATYRARNGFGGMNREVARCRVAYIGSNNWRLVDLSAR